MAKNTKKQFFGGTLYAITPGWPGEELILKNVQVDKRRSVVTMLGLDEPLAWTQKRDDVIIEVPQLSPDQLPCRHAWTFKLTHVE